MAELLFKRGLHGNLPTTAVDGAFYLTTDTHRLYAGVGSELVDLNKYILTYASLDDLKSNWSNAEEGDFAFVVKENVLAYYTGTTWTQINTNTDTTNKQFNKTGTGSTLTLELEDSNGSKVPVEVLFIGTEGISVEVSNSGDVTIAGTTYDLETALSGTTTFTVTLSNSGAEDETDFVLQAGSNVSFAAAGDNGIIITAQDTQLSTTPGDNTAVADGDGNLIVTIKDTVGNEAVATATEAFYYTVNGATVYNQNELPVYSKTEIDSKFNDLNPMTYKGVVTSADDLDTKTKVKIGDTYMVGGDGFTYNGEAVESGDLFIATGTEGSDGYITGTVTWTYVPAGNDTHIDTRYYATANDKYHSITVKNTTADDVMMTIDLNGDDKITLESVVTSEGDGENNVLTTTIKHAAPGAGSITAGTGSNHADSLVVNVPTSFVIDSTGHVASYKEDTYTLATYEIDSNAATAENNVATFESQLKSSDGTDRGTVAFNLDASASDSLNVTASGNTIVMKLEWGTF